MKIILASASPRRRELLTQCGLSFEAAPQPVDETLPKGIAPEDAVAYLSRIKARACADMQSTGALILGADTIVAKDGVIFGKPANKEEACRMLRALSGGAHQVYTGVTLLCGESTHTFVSKTSVFFYPLSAAEINAYVESGEPMDKAGAYGIQGKGGLLVEKMEGDYYTVVGLPIARLMREISARYPAYLEEARMEKRSNQTASL